ncbi:MAG: family 10 glycosylhydrolase, partial [Candidatus Marinimicrobia bacterium]|nr:family 10 glycosylhydrolase [Candidatus Neomarinimicrobiota bacterium]
MRITKILLLLGLFSVSGWSQTGNTEFRSTWVITWEHIHSSWTAEQNKTRVREILDNHKAANMNAVLWQARQSGTAYYNSSYEPWGYYAGSSDPGYDPLAYAIEEAHKRGIEVHAWFNVFSAASTAAGTPAAEHPDWVCRDQSGIPMSESRALSPGLAAVRDYTLNVAMEIVNNYDIDGIHLDYIRWNEYSNSSRSNLTQIEQESQLDGMISEQQIEALDNSRTGRYLYDVDHPYNSGVPAGYGSWEEWWRSSVTTFVEMLHDSIQAVKPHVRLSVAALGKYNWSGWQGYGSVYQDAAKWFNDGSIEQLTPMSYHWLDATSFYNMLEGDCPECWGQWIQPGVSAGRLFSAGPGSYRLSEN